ncbi:hypothetical protein FHY56_11270 [Brucella gallinifaecis]|uniref:Uncharacterized protein n=1 Tax=Brucella gallinifaecis TaxID=215590 RepID=A0A502BKA6_9HYPH|nr:hypothetical protein FHY56_11270 [Brucella gallinifaecis]
MISTVKCRNALLFVFTQVVIGKPVPSFPRHVLTAWRQLLINLARQYGRKLIRKTFKLSADLARIT